MATVPCSSPEFWLLYRERGRHDTRDTPATEDAAKARTNRDRDRVFSPEKDARMRGSRGHATFTTVGDAQADNRTCRGAR